MARSLYLIIWNVKQRGGGISSVLILDDRGALAGVVSLGAGIRFKRAAFRAQRALTMWHC